MWVAKHFRGARSAHFAFCERREEKTKSPTPTSCLVSPCPSPNHNLLCLLLCAAEDGPATDGAEHVLPQSQRGAVAAIVGVRAGRWLYLRLSPDSLQIVSPRRGTSFPRLFRGVCCRSLGFAVSVIGEFWCCWFGVAVVSLIIVVVVALRCCFCGDGSSLLPRTVRMHRTCHETGRVVHVSCEMAQRAARFEHGNSGVRDACRPLLAALGCFFMLSHPTWSSVIYLVSTCCDFS